MNAMVVDLLDVPLLEDTIVQNSETGVFPRVFVLRNLTANAISYKIQESADGGTRWTDLTLSNGTTQVTLGLAGGGHDMTVERITSLSILRVRASGGDDDRDLEVALHRVYRDTSHVWSNALL